MASTEKYDKLAKRVDLFLGLSPEDTRKIFARGMTMRVAKGETVSRKGTVGNQMFVVLGGKVSVFDGRKHLADLRTGDMFGEMALVSNEPRSATAVAAEDANLYVLNETFFDKLMTKRVAVRILLNIIATLSRRLRKANAKLAQFGTRE